MHRLTSSEKKYIIELLNKGLSANDIAIIIGCCNVTVYNIAKDNNIIMGGQPSTLEGKQEEISLLVSEGIAYREIARRYNVSRNTVRTFCRRNGFELSTEQKSANIESAHKCNEVSKVVELLDKEGRYEYISGYVNRTDPMTVRCKTCGHVFDVSLKSILNDNRQCPECTKQNEERKAEEQKILKENREREREEKRAKRVELEKHKQEERERRRNEKLHECPVCGKLTTRPVYCSNVCSNKALNKRHEHARRCKTNAAMVDKDISLQRLYKRDNGVCYICGLPCLWDDYKTENDTIIAGNWYPSIDHVVPLSRNGKHAWCNVRLAHRICNSAKSDKICISPGYLPARVG